MKKRILNRYYWGVFVGMGMLTLSYYLLDQRLEWWTFLAITAVVIVMEAIINTVDVALGYRRAKRERIAQLTALPPGVD